MVGTWRRTSSRVKGTKPNINPHANKTALQAREMTREVCIATINVRGLKSQAKVDSLCLLLEELEIDVCVVTETHMTEQEAKNLYIEGYEVQAECCRPESSAGGGAIILMGFWIDSDTIENQPTLPPLLNACAAIIYPHCKEATGMRLTGVYFSPSAKMQAEDIKALMESKNQSYAKSGIKLNHLLTGDFNPKSWKGDDETRFLGWLSTEGLWELSSPTIPTHEEGSVLDRMLLLPGDEVPWEWIPPEPKVEVSNAQEAREACDLYYPAVTFPCPKIADRRPILLRTQGTAIESRVPISRLRIAGLTKEEWECRNEQLEEKLRESKEALKNAITTHNTMRYWDILSKAIRTILADKYTKPRPPKKGRRTYVSFRTKHKSHPDMPQLVSATADRDTEVMDALTRKISRDHWKEFLSKTKISEIIEVFTYLAKAEGRKSKGFRFSCAAPLHTPEGGKSITTRDKCNVLADYFHAKLTGVASPTRGEEGLNIMAQREMEYRNTFAEPSNIFGRSSSERPSVVSRKKKPRGQTGFQQGSTRTSQSWRNISADFSIAFSRVETSRSPSSRSTLSLWTKKVAILPSAKKKTTDFHHKSCGQAS